MNLSSFVLLAAENADLGARVGSGVISGGWGYVWASYAITWTVFAAYGLSLWVRRPPSTRKVSK